MVPPTPFPLKCWKRAMTVDDFIAMTAINNIELGRRGRPDNDLKYTAKVARLVDPLYILKNKLKQKEYPWK